MTWLVYGLLANRESDHDLRFIERSDHPQSVADEHRETYDAVMAFPEDTADKVEPGGRLEIAPVAALLGCGRASWPNAAQRAGRGSA